MLFIGLTNCLISYFLSEMQLLTWQQSLNLFVAKDKDYHSKTLSTLLHCIECTVSRKIFYQICDYCSSMPIWKIKLTITHPPTPLSLGNFSVQH